MLFNLALSDQFESYGNEIMQTYGASGMAVAIVNRDRPLQELFFGFRDREQKLPIDRDTLFGLASVTKSFTCLAILYLAQQGRIDLDAPVSRYIPDFQNAHRRQPVLVRHLMSHTGSFWPVARKTVEPLARKMGLWNTGIDLAYSVPFSQEALREVCAGLDAQDPPLGEPGEYFSYSNDSFGLLSDIIRTQGGEDTYAAYLDRHLLQPLGMERSGCGFLKPAADPNAAVLYERRDGKLLTTRDFHDNAFVMMGGGAMKSTLRDMERYLQLFLRGGVPLLSAESFAQMTGCYASYRPGVGYGFGLSVSHLAGVPVFGHGGSLTGVSSAICFCPEAGFGVVVLCNTSGVPATSVAEAAMRWCLGQSPRPEDPVPGKPWSKEAQQKACGRYVCAEDSQLEICMEQGEMMVRSSGKSYPYRFGGENVLYLQSKLTWSDVTLFPGPDGLPFALRYGGRMLARQ